MTASTIEAAIWRGMGSAARVLGFPYQQFRPASVTNPTAGTPFNASVNVAVSVKPNNFDLMPDYEKPDRCLYVDGTQTQVGDYFTGGPLGTLAVISQNPMLPIGGVVCNHVLNFARPPAATTMGAQTDYGGDIQGDETPLLTGWPAYLGTAGRGTRGPGNLVGDVELPRVDIRLPMWGGVVLLNGDVVFDEDGRRYKIISAEGTALGWRIIATLQMA